MRYVIIGNGVAGIQAANQIRLRHESARITIISKESDHFFSRTALMYVFSGQMKAQDVEPYPRDHYQRMNFERIRGEVKSLDSKNKSVILNDGRTIVYDRLLLALGSVARKGGWPGEGLKGTGNFVTWQDLEWLTATAEKASRAVIIGGGLIGIEVAEVLHTAGIQVDFLIREKWFWPAALDAYEGTLVANHIRDHGIKVHLETECREIVELDGRAAGVITTAGNRMEADIVAITIGVVPQTSWLVDSGLSMDNTGGLVVDEHLRTNIPDIWAAGDCTSVVWFNGIRRPEQLWYTSRDQGKRAGLNMAGDNRTYTRGVFYNSAKLFDIEYTTAGFVNFKFEGEKNWFFHEAGTNNSTRITYLADGTVVGFNFLGRRWDHRLLVQWVEEKRPFEWVLGHLKNANFDEEFQPRFSIARVST